MSKVSIGKTIDYTTLETALVKAAEEMGWKARVEDRFNRSYKLGSVEEVQEYDDTHVYLKGRLLPAMQVIIFNKGPRDNFYIWSDFPFGFASERRVQEYLSAVSRNL